VVEDEWSTMGHGTESPSVQAWLDDMASTVASVRPRGERETVGYSQWFNQDAERRDGRRGRLAEAERFVPPLLWFVLLLGVAVVVGYMLLFADPRERWWVQGLMIGGTTAVLASGLIVVGFLDTPYSDTGGGIGPSDMQRTLSLIERTTTPAIDPAQIPCDARGVAIVP
jgi:hypothetical protein